MKQTYVLFLAMLKYTMWALSAVVVLNFTAAEFVPLVYVVSNLGLCIQDCLESALTVSER